MSASGVREMLATVDGVRCAARIYCGVELSERQAALCRFIPIPQRDDRGWMDHPCAVSAGPVVYLKRRIAELTDSPLAILAPDERDDVPLVLRRVSGKTVVDVCPVARSKMWRSPLVVYPIDLTALRVAGVKV